MISQCIFCGSFDTSISEDHDRCAECAGVFGKPKDGGSIGAISVAIAAPSDRLSPAHGSWPQVPVTARGLAPPPLPDAYVSRMTQRVPVLKMEQFAKSSEGYIRVAEPVIADLDGAEGSGPDAGIPAALLGLTENNAPTVRPRSTRQPSVPADPIPLVRRRRARSWRQVGAVAMLTGFAFVGLVRTHGSVAAADVASGTFAIAVPETEDPVGASKAVQIRSAQAETARTSAKAAAEPVVTDPVPPVVPAPRTSEAPSCESLAALGNGALSSGDRDAARHFFTLSEQANPRFLPAQLGLADVAWKNGDREGAKKRYSKIVAEYPSAVVPLLARVRATHG